MDMEEFKEHLRRRGKKEHVAQALVAYVQQFAEYLQEQREVELQSASTSDLEGYSGWVEERQKGRARKVVRGIALYYEMIGRKDIAALAREIREEAISKTRKVFALKDIRGVDEEYVQKLAQEGIVDVEQMIEAGKTPSLRAELSGKTGIPPESILEFVKLSDLTRVGALKSVRARLYYDAGVDTVEKLAQWEPEELRLMFLDFVERTGFDGITPLPKEVSNAVATARELERLVEY